VGGNNTVQFVVSLQCRYQTLQVTVVKPANFRTLHQSLATSNYYHSSVSKRGHNVPHASSCWQYAQHQCM